MFIVCFECVKARDNDNLLEWRLCEGREHALCKRCFPGLRKKIYWNIFWVQRAFESLYYLSAALTKDMKNSWCWLLRAFFTSSLEYEACLYLTTTNGCEYNRISAFSHKIAFGLLLCIFEWSKWAMLTGNDSAVMFYGSR